MFTKKYLFVIGQSKLPILNKVGIYMYWNNCWLNFFQKDAFFKKTLFFENLLFFIFSESGFEKFFQKKIVKNNTCLLLESDKPLKDCKIKKCYKIGKCVRGFFSTILAKFKTLKKNTKSKENYYFGKVWLVKYNSFILVSVFCFFYINIKKTKFLNKISKKNKKQIKPFLFWKKRFSKNRKKIEKFIKNVGYF